MQKPLITDDLLFSIKARRDELNVLFTRLTAALKKAPAGSLKIVKRPNVVQFYHRKTTTDKQGTYIQKKNYKLAASLAQKDYNKKASAILQKQLKILNKTLEAYNEEDLRKLYASYIPEVQALITPVVLTPKQYAEEWQAVTYQGLSTDNITTEFFTLRDEHVRSKSEVMIANALFHADIPYRYEFPIPIKGADDFHPDFLCLNPNTGREIIWEHFGLMDDPEYAANAFSKISRYAENGYILGYNFIYTMETSTQPLSTRFVNKLIETHFSS